MGSEAIDRSKVARLIEEARFFLNEIEGRILGGVPDDDELRSQYEQEGRNAAGRLNAQVSGLERELGPSNE